MTADGMKAPGGRAEWLMSLIWRKPAATVAERTRRRVVVHLIPWLFFLYILAYLDRVNVSVAGLDMAAPPDRGGVGFDEAVFGFGSGIFFLGYWILEIPSTVSVVRWGARWVFVRILVLWGICAALVGTIGLHFAASLFGWVPHVAEQSGFVDWMDGLFRHPVAAGTAHFINGLHDHPAYQFYFFRFMLGFFEGGFFPSVIVYLSHWFRAEDRAKAIAAFMAAIPLSQIIGAPVSGLILGLHWLDLPGWRWVFVLEGIAPVLAGFATLFFLPDRPDKAKWLPADERAWLVAELDREHQAKQGQGHWVWVHHLGMVLLLTGVYFCLNLTSYGLSMFMPKIIKSQLGLQPATQIRMVFFLVTSSQLASFLAALPYVMAIMAMLVNGWHSDRRRERIWHAAVPLSLLSLGIWLAAAVDGIAVLPVVVMIVGVGTFLYAHLPAFWPIPTMFLGATTAAAAIGFINMIGNLGGFFGPWLVGEEATRHTTFVTSLQTIAPWPLVGAAVILIVGYTRRRSGQSPAR